MSTSAQTDPDLPSPTPAPRVVIDVTWTAGARAALQSSFQQSSAQNELSVQPQNVRAWNRALRSAIALTCVQAQPHAHAARYVKRHPDNATWKIDATFVSDHEMTELNARYRGKNRSTDVLSFAQSEDDGEANFVDETGDEKDTVFAFGASDEIVWGDLVIAVETAQRQAIERAHAVSTEVCFLAIHGTLHLLGYDHQNSTQRRVMWRAQERIFELATQKK